MLEVCPVPATSARPRPTWLFLILLHALAQIASAQALPFSNGPNYGVW